MANQLTRAFESLGRTLGNASESGWDKPMPLSGPPHIKTPAQAKAAANTRAKMTANYAVEDWKSAVEVIKRSAPNVNTAIVKAKAYHIDAWNKAIAALKKTGLNDAAAEQKLRTATEEELKNTTNYLGMGRRSGGKRRKTHRKRATRRRSTHRRKTHHRRR